MAKEDRIVSALPDSVVVEKKVVATHVAMKRAAELANGGPTEANVHVAEVDNWKRSGWYEAK